MNTSICKSFNCPFWSEGTRSTPGAPISNYGCKRFSVATHCLVSQVVDVSAKEYELFYDKSKASPNRETLIRLGLKYLVDQEIKEKHQTLKSRFIEMLIDPPK
jgi:hypothetical protein